MVSSKFKILGDFQTPVPLAEKVCKLVLGSGYEPDIVVEPTCGSGNFIVAASNTFSKGFECYCLEVQPEYHEQFEENTRNYREKCRIHHVTGNVLDHEFPMADFKHKNVLVLGNLPWVTSAGLTALGADNPVKKGNFGSLRGLDAITGKSNFDLAEAIFTKLINDFSQVNARIALICKFIVARNMIHDMERCDLKISNATWYELDAWKEFRVAAHAGVLDVTTGRPISSSCEARFLDDPRVISHRFGWSGRNFVSDLSTYTKTSVIEGRSCIEWRQGVKTDAFRVMTFTTSADGLLVNGFGEVADIEKDLVYPFVKGSRLGGQVIHATPQAMLVPQARLGADTSTIATAHPRTWDYLVAHGSVLDGRKSRVYLGKPRFSIFGVGDYSFRPYKIAVASMYKEPEFSLVCPVNGKPVMLDDTSYFIGFDDLHHAIVVHALLSQDVVKQFLDSIVFKDGKRVYTKGILMRIDLSRVLSMTREDRLLPSISGIQAEMVDKRVVVEASNPREMVSKARDWLEFKALERGIQNKQPG
nr:hypothetical protein [Candidatus Sigynarchaeota archaeon]